MWLLLYTLLPFMSLSGGSEHVYGQTGVINGRVYDEVNNSGIAYANVIIQGSTRGSTSDSNGYYSIEGLDPGVYNLQVSYIGYETAMASEVVVLGNMPTTVNIGMVASATALNEVVVRASPFRRNDVSPVSLNSIGVNEIQRSPGGNRDISKVVQTLPGVATTASFRNDLIVRGGSPNENRFYLDGIEVPTINHFATQGATGGPVGLINVDFIRSVDFYSGAFPASRGNTLSSLLEFRQREGRSDRVGLTGTIGSNDLGMTLEGPMGVRSSFMLSARVSYLQWLFKALGLPFLPLYTDGQFKSFHKFDDRHDLTLVGLGAYDRFTLNTARDGTEEQRYLLGVLPYQNQYNYTFGARYRYFRNKGAFTFVVSRSFLWNEIYKYSGNENDDPDKLLFDYLSHEAENKLRLEHVFRTGGVTISYGAGYEYAGYYNRTFQNEIAGDSVYRYTYKTDIGIHKYAAFAQVSKKFASENIGVSLGIRSDGNSFDPEMRRFFRHISPRVSLSAVAAPGLVFSANAGLFYQLPPYTTFGYKDEEGLLVNRDNGLEYIRNFHAVAGAAYTTGFNAKFSVEGFYKRYSRYPMLVSDGVSLANLGGDFGVVGDEEVRSESRGRTYGLEFLVQQKLYKGYYGILTYTWYRSMFTNEQGSYVPSAWDFRHIVTMVGGKKFRRNWELGVKWTYYGGGPYTPYDTELSLLTPVWDVNNEGLFDYDRINTRRLRSVHRMDVRVDKKWYFERWTLDLYLDITNFYNQVARGQDFLTIQRDEAGSGIEDPSNPGSYLPAYIPDEDGQLIPTLGVVISF